MLNNKGSTLVEVLLSLLILSILILVVSRSNYFIHRLILANAQTQQMGQVAKNKIEELKSNRIYIEGEEHLIFQLEYENISFVEEEYNVDVSIKPLYENPNIKYINVSVSNHKDNRIYNLIRYINLAKADFHDVYEELVIESDTFNY